METIEKPWAVYGWSLGPEGIGKIVSEHQQKIAEISYFEKQHYASAFWNLNRVKRFDSPIKAIAYFRVHKKDDPITKQEAIDYFLFRFPSERNNIEKLLAQSLPKCTNEKSKRVPPFGETAC